MKWGKWVGITWAWFCLLVSPAWAQWTAYNDHAAGSGTHSNATCWNIGGTANGAPGASGALKNIINGTNLPAILSIINNSASFGAEGVNPSVGTPAYDLFHGYVDFSGSPNPSASLSGAQSVTYRITGLNPNRRYGVRGSAIRGDASYVNRWTLVELNGAVSCVPAHSANVYYSGLAVNQAAVCTGVNHTAATGDVAGWEDINPGTDGVIEIATRQYTGAIPGKTTDGARAYAMTALRLEEFVGGSAVITRSPQSVSAIAGTMVSLKVETTGYPIVYQWQKDGSEVSGATNSSLVFNAVKLADAGNYTVRVTGTSNTLASDAARLTVYADMATNIITLTNTAWRYDVSGATLDPAWKEPGFDDSTWLSGYGVFATEDNAAITVLTRTPLPLATPGGQRILTHYFRTTFTCSSTGDLSGAVLKIRSLVDDGAVLYLNGEELVRWNLPQGELAPTTLATSAEEEVFLERCFSAERLVKGTNVLAVLLRQTSASSSDAVMGMEVFLIPADFGPVLVAEPPQSAQVTPGAGALFTARVGGMRPVTCQWFKNGMSIAGATNPSLAFASVTLADDGRYTCLFSNEFGTVLTDAALLTFCEWQAGFGSDGWEQVRCLLQTADGGYLLGGVSSSSPGGNKTPPLLGDSDFYLVRLDAKGNELWQKTYGGSGDDEVFSMVQTADGGFMLAGYATSEPGGTKTAPHYGAKDFWVVRTDANGNQLWDRSYGGTGDDIPWSIIETEDHGFAIGGASLSPTSGNKTSPFYGGSDQWLVRIDAQGNKLWDSYLGTAQWEYGYAVRETFDGGFVTGGQFGATTTPGNKTSPAYGGVDLGIFKVDANGRNQWDRSFGGSHNDGIYDLDITADGGFLLGADSWSGISGTKTSVNYGANDFYLVRVNNGGQKLWEKAYGGPGEDSLRGIRYLPDGGAIMVGFGGAAGGVKTGNNYGNKDYWIVRVDANGTKLWDLDFGGQAEEEAFDVIPTADGGFLVGGYSYSAANGNKSVPTFGDQDIWVIKVPRIDPLVAPTMSSSPVGGLYTTGDKVLLRTVANGFPLAYQWYKNGQPIAGATKPSFCAPKASISDAGQYQVVASNQLGAVTSSVASVAVLLDRSVPLVHLTGTPWSYNQSGADLGDAWKEVSFLAENWPLGCGLFALDSSPIAHSYSNTVLKLVNDTGVPVITHYFCTRFLLTQNPATYCLVFSNLVDDGAVVYLNGQEIYRINMDNGPVKADSLARPMSARDFIGKAILPPANLVPGMNVLAVELHQDQVGSPDALFGLSLSLVPLNAGPVRLLQSPGHQFITPDGAVVFQAAASGELPLSFQWYKDGVSLQDGARFSGATTASLQLANPGRADFGDYQVVITNPYGAVTSAVANLAMMAPANSWAGGLGASDVVSSNENHPAVTVDRWGNVFCAGAFEGEAPFGKETFASRGLRDAFLAKYRTDGVLQWAHQIGNANDEGVQSVVVDDAGNSYFAGWFAGNFSLEHTNIISAGDTDLFVACYNPAGIFQWVRTFGGSGQEEVGGLALDGTNGLYLTGSFRQQSRFGTNTLTSQGGADIFLAHLDTAGAVQWALAAGGTEDDHAAAVNVDVQGQCWLTGHFHGTAAIADRVWTSSGAADFFLAKYDVTGQGLWSVRGGGSGVDEGVALAADGAGGVYVTGRLCADAECGGQWIGSGVTPMFFVARYDREGSLQWLRSPTSLGASAGAAVGVDEQQNCYVAGAFSGNPKFGCFSVASVGQKDIFTAKYFADGTLAWLTVGGGPGNDEPRSLALLGPDRLLVAGSFQDRADFGNLHLTGAAGNSLFVTMFGEAALPRLALTVSNQVPVVSFSGTSAAPWTLEWTDALTTNSVWHGCLELSPTGGVHQVPDATGVGTSRRFYRLTTP